MSESFFLTIVLLFAYGVTDAALDVAAGHSQYNYSPVYSYSHSAAAQERSSSGHVSAADLHKHMKKMDETKKHMDAKLAEIAKKLAAVNPDSIVLKNNEHIGKCLRDFLELPHPRQLQEAS